MGWKHYQTVDHPKREPQVGSGLFGIRLLILHFKFQFTKFIKSSTFHISFNLTYPLRKNISFQKCPKITQKFTQNRLTVVNVMSIEIQRCLKRDRDIGKKAVLSHVKTAFTCTPAFNLVPRTFTLAWGRSWERGCPALILERDVFEPRMSTGSLCSCFQHVFLPDQ